MNTAANGHKIEDITAVLQFYFKERSYFSIISKCKVKLMSQISKKVIDYLQTFFI